MSELIFFTHQIWQMKMNSTQQSVKLIDLKKNEMHYYAKGQYVNRLKKGKIKQIVSRKSLYIQSIVTQLSNTKKF